MLFNQNTIQLKFYLKKIKHNHAGNTIVFALTCVFSMLVLAAPRFHILIIYNILSAQLPKFIWGAYLKQTSLALFVWADLIAELSEWATNVI